MDAVGESRAIEVTEAEPIIEATQPLSVYDMLKDFETEEEAIDREHHEQEHAAVVHELETHFGAATILYYGKYQGPISQVANECPAIRSTIASGGFEAARDLIEQHAQLEPQEDEQDEENNLVNQESRDETESAAEPERSELKKELSEAPVVVKALPKVKEARKQMVSSEAALPKPQRAGESKSTEPQPEPEKAIPKEHVPVERTHHEEAEPIEEAPVVIAVRPVEEHPETMVEVAEPIAELEESSHEKNSANDSSGALLNNEEAVEFIPLKEEVNHHEVVITDEIIEQFEAWNDIAESEPPFEVMVQAIIDDMNVAFEIPEEDRSTDFLEQEIELNSDETEVTGDALTQVMNDVELVEELETIDDESLQALFAEEARPEYYSLYITVRSAQGAVEKLFTATTQEECKMYLEQIQFELSKLLRALGYDNPEKVIRAYLSRHSPEALRTLMQQLEYALRKKMYRDIRARQTLRSQVRHTRLGKFIDFIVQAIVPRHISVPHLSE
jgi:hypothetical protein